MSNEPKDTAQKPTLNESEVTSTGMPWSEVGDFALPYAEWLDGRHGPAEDALPSLDQVPIPTVLFALPVLHEDRPRGSKAMADVHGAKQRLANCRPGAWLLSPYTGWQWAKWPNGEVGWLPADIALPDTLRVRARNDTPKTNMAAPNAFGSKKQAAPSANTESVSDTARRNIANNPRFKEARLSGQGFVFGGMKPSNRRSAAFETLLTTLRQDEPALGNLTVTDQSWLTTALARLIQIDESRRAENAHGSSYCIFESGRAYFQCLAPSFGTYLRCEAVSEKFVPEMRAILTSEKSDRLVHEFGLAAPGYSKNFSQKIEIEDKDDLAYVARMAFRVLRDAYNVTDFRATGFKVSIPTPAKPVFHTNSGSQIITTS